MGHRKKKASAEDVELNVTAMLDMAFQLLAFFILTFRPPPIEGQVFMRMPPAQSVLGPGAQSAGDDEKKDPKEVKPVKTLTITLLDEGTGSIKSVMVGVPTVGMQNIPYNELSSEISKYFKGEDQFEQVIIQAASSLQWEYVMQAMETCSKQTFSDGKKLNKLSFIALPDK